MNFLAHAHLSGKNNDVLLGNFVADAIKGKKLLEYRKEIQYGILLHRKIDSFTDKHELFKQSANRVRKDFGRYSGIVIDIYYDHFLALNWKEYDDRELHVFAAFIYGILSRNVFILPNRTKKLLPFMISQNWLTSYANFDGLKHVFNGMDRRTGRISGMENAVIILKQNYDELFADFKAYYPILIDFSKNSLEKIINDSNNIK